MLGEIVKDITDQCSPYVAECKKSATQTLKIVFGLLLAQTLALWILVFLGVFRRGT